MLLPFFAAGSSWQFAGDFTGDDPDFLLLLEGMEFVLSRTCGFDIWLSNLHLVTGLQHNALPFIPGQDANKAHGIVGVANHARAAHACLFSLQAAHLTCCAYVNFCLCLLSC